MNNLRIIFVGSGKRGAYCLKKLVESNKEIILCITNYKTSNSIGLGLSRSDSSFYVTVIL